MPTNSFLAPDSLLGWTAADWTFLGLAVAGGFVSQSRTTPVAQTVRLVIARIAARSWLSAALLFAIPILLRVVLLPHVPVPVPSGADDFGYLFLADTLRHARLANPAVTHPEFFEQVFLLQDPTRSSIYPLGQGVVLMLSWLGTGTPWIGILLLSGLFSALCGWMLRGWTTPEWAFTGALLAGTLFGPLCYWTNCYWGGFVSAIAGCVVAGALPRRNLYIAGFGLALQLLTRPFEFGLLFIATVLFLLPDWRPTLRGLTIWAVCLLPAFACIAAQNTAVTGSWKTLPYVLYRYQYGAPSTFTFEASRPPHRELNSEQLLDYQAEAAVHGDHPDTLSRFASRLWGRLRLYRFFLYAPLYLAVPLYLWKARTWRTLWPVFTIGLMAIGSNFYPYFYPHYIAAAACLFLLIAVLGLQHMPPGLRRSIVATCFLQFGFWYLWHAAAKSPSPLESWDYVNGADPQGRKTVAKRLAAEPGNKIVFVHYSPVHGFAEWVHNEADLAAAPVWYVHDLGSTKNGVLLQEHPDRKPWLLLPDETPPLLQPYKSPSSPFEDVP